jgi:hypothetical protein
VTGDDDDEAYIYLLWRDAVPVALRAPDMAHNAGKQKRAITVISTYCVFHVESGAQRDYEYPHMLRVRCWL